jgi:hypothetical protein
MSKDTLSHAIREAVKEVLGHDALYYGPHSSKLKDGTRVYRIAGTGSMDYLFKRDGKVWLHRTHEGRPAEPVHITKEMAEGNYQRDDLHYRKWEWRLLDRGREQVEQELDKAIHARGVHNIEVQIGGGNSSYPTSLAFKVLGSNRKKQAPPPELALLFSSLPPAGSSWSAVQRKRWIETARRSMY